MGDNVKVGKPRDGALDGAIFGLASGVIYRYESSAAGVALTGTRSNDEVAADGSPAV